MATFEDMEKAACCMLQIIKDTPELVKDTKVAIAGSMAMQYHLPKYTQDGAAQSIDLIINSTTSASLLRKKLLQHPMSPLVERNQLLYFQPSSATKTSPSSPRSPGTEVRITPEMLLPFLPGAAKLVHEVSPSPGHLPYVSLVDLIVFKMDSCGLRDSTQGKQQEARDAAALLEAATQHCALELNENQIRVVEECLPDILRHSSSDKGWWQARLIGRCDPDARKPAKEVLADLIENMSLDDSGKRSPPAMGRTPSSSSKTSLSSMASSSSGNFVASTSPVSSNSPGLPPPSKDLLIPRRPRKFSTSQQSPTKTFHTRKQSTDPKPKRHSQILGSLPSGPYNSPSPSDDGGHGSPGLTLTARFESTPGDEKLVTGSYF